MKTYLLTLGRGTGTDSLPGMMITLRYNLWAWTYLGDMYRELVTIFDKKFALQFYTNNGNTFATISVDDDVADEFSTLIYTAMNGELANIELKEAPDFFENIPDDVEIASTELYQTRNYVYPVNTGADFKSDSLEPLVNIMANLPQDDNVIVQVVSQPIKDTAFLHWRLTHNRQHQKLFRRFNMKYWFKKDVLEDVEKRISDKSILALYNTTIRFAAFKACEKNDKARYATREYLKSNLSALVAGYGQFGDPDLNILKPTVVRYGANVLRQLRERSFGRKMIFSSLELSSLWHPTASMPTYKNLAVHKAVPPEVPRNTDALKVAVFGRSNYRSSDIEFGFSRPDLRKHLYVIGKSGMGKSCLIQILVRNDMQEGRGLAVIDPHGDLVDNILRLVPKERVNDVIILDPSDRDFPAAFNPLAWVPAKQRLQVTSGIIDTFRRLLFGIWNDHLELLIRYMSIALLSTHDATMLSVERLLTDARYRSLVADNCDDEGVADFWEDEFAEWSEKHQADAITPLLEWVGQFLSSDMIRNVVSQPINKFDFRSIIDSNKILLVRVSKGLLGEENAALFGSLVVNKIYQAAMSRADISEDKRHDFYFYIDEFQAFAGGNIKSMLAESRKYHLNLILAHQVLGQIPDDVAKTIFGNVGNIVSFCVSGSDAGVLSNEFSGEVDGVSLTNLPVQDFYVKMLVNDNVIKPFSGRTTDIVYPKEDYSEECREISRSLYATPVNRVMDLLVRWEKGDGFIQRPELFGEPPLDLRHHLRRYGTVLQLSDLDISDEHLLQLSHVAFDNVRELVLSNTKITDHGMEALSCLRNLVYLRLDGTAITDNALRELSNLPRLRKLVLDRTRVSDFGLQFLQDLHLSEISLRETNITDKGLTALAECGGLTEIAMENTSVSAKGVSKFKSLMPDINIHFS